MGLLIVMLQDHPRACGEHCVILAGSTRGAGSSPRLRGTIRIEDHDTELRGIIPALAGNIMA